MAFLLIGQPSLRYWLLLLLFFSSCTTDPLRRGSATTIEAAQTRRAPLRSPLNQLGDRWVTGDFDGDQQPDTVCQFLVDSTGQRFITRPDSALLLEADELSAWYLAHDVRVILTLTRPNSDTLHLLNGQGLYCLFNLGDTNHDGRDEVAFVVNYADFSRLNTCQVASFCHGKWLVEKPFHVFEGAFDEAPPRSSSITGFLEKRHRQWYYTDYLADDTPDSTWYPLQVKRCR